MSYADVGITILWTFLFGYIIVASIDFGAGFFSYYSVVTGHQNVIHNIVQRYLSPVWEVTNVFLVFFYVGLVGFFPDAAYYYGTALLVLGSVAIVLLAIRGAYYAFNTYGSSTKERSKVYMALYGATGLLIPAGLSTILAISEGGIIEEAGGRVLFDWREFFTNPYTWSVIILAIVSVLYISAMFLAYYAKKARDQGAFKILRGYALFWSGPTILASLFAFFQIYKQNPEHFMAMIDNSWMFVASLLFFLVAVYFMVKGENLGLGFIAVMLQFGFAWFGYGRSHLPYILYPYINIHESITNESTAIALIIVFAAGLLVVIPSIVLIMRLFLFNAKYVSGQSPKKG
ncbi:cytochrome d ubiquinol oxidase subunit II [Paenibacillus sediminis]|uniref:Cytochrome d ubiquinol oxidase subunit II n=1 Tax=Paenibacillus sediminis TaxID=664909 RepID=A0ABS4H3L5_9BACL|nr:cytochrome d ubiquinol oxidase subunit II [Paenibacillus sediminis]MBP1937128.1 cytochrome d ubiquinol oxidase subunit II [Paenibacillus sediminis]